MQAADWWNGTLDSVVILEPSNVFSLETKFFRLVFLLVLKSRCLLIQNIVKQKTSHSSEWINGNYLFYHLFDKKTLRSVHTIQFWCNYCFKFFCVWWKMLAFTQSNFPIQLFRGVLQRNMTILVLWIYAHFTAARSSCGGHFVKIFCRMKRGKIKIGGSFDLIGWK